MAKVRPWDRHDREACHGAHNRRDPEHNTLRRAACCGEAALRFLIASFANESCINFLLTFSYLSPGGVTVPQQLASLLTK